MYPGLLSLAQAIPTEEMMKEGVRRTGFRTNDTQMSSLFLHPTYILFEGEEMKKKVSQFRNFEQKSSSTSGPVVVRRSYSFYTNYSPLENRHGNIRERGSVVVVVS